MINYSPSSSFSLVWSTVNIGFLEMLSEQLLSSFFLKYLRFILKGIFPGFVYLFSNSKPGFFITFGYPASWQRILHTGISASMCDLRHPHFSSSIIPSFLNLSCGKPAVA